MRICIIATDYPSKGRPSFVFVEQLVNQLLEHGVEVVVVAPQSLTHALIHKKALRPNKSWVNSLNGIKYKVYRPYHLSVGDNYPKVTWCLNYLKSASIEKIVKKEQPDVLYAHFWENAEVIDGIVRKYKLPLFVACGEGDNAIEMMIDRMTECRIEELAASVMGVISVSTENKRKCIEYGLCRDDNVVVLPNCVDTKVFRCDSSLSIRAELGITEEDFVIAFCGAFIKRKGSRRLSEAIKKLNDPHIKSIFVGKPFDGEDETPDCSGIVFMGGVEHNVLPKYLNSADLFVLPTQKEGCCNAIVEALACGLPIVSSDGAFNDDILDESNSIRTNPEDVDAIAEAIRTFKTDKERRARAASYILASGKKYSLEQRAGNIINFIQARSHVKDHSK